MNILHDQILDDAPDSDTFIKPEGYPLQDGEIYILNENEASDNEKVDAIVVRAKRVRCPWALQRNVVSTIFGIIFLSVPHTFLPEGVVLWFWKFAQSFKSKQK